MNHSHFLPIKKIANETDSVKTFYFQQALGSKPGQFVMLWIPGLDQKPFSVAFDDGQTFGLTIFKRGPLTEKLFSLNTGDRVGIAGPYGTSFSVKPSTHYVMVAGGYGAAPLGFLAEKLIGLPDVKIDFIAGARSDKHLFFEERLSKISNLKLHLATDDGSVGRKGYVTDLLTPLLMEEGQGVVSDKSLVVTCGPELMEKKVLDICNQNNIECEVSIERYMKCGVGVCGQCAIDPLGICMCTHGPVVSKELANQLTEFGSYHRDKTGAIIKY